LALELKEEEKKILGGNTGLTGYFNFAAIGGGRGVQDLVEKKRDKRGEGISQH